VEISPDEAALFLIRATFGPTEEDILAVMDSGYEAWIDGQMSLPISRQLPLLESRLAADGLNPLELASPVPHLQNARMDTWWELAIRAPDQLRQRVAFALSEILVISDLGQLARPVHAIASYHDMLVENAFGNYRELLEDVTLHPAMGSYLSMRRNEKADEGNNIRPDENFARECMQLFSIGLVMLNLDGTVQMDGGQPIPTYGQQQITEFSRVYTGWNFFNAPRFVTNLPISTAAYTTPMRAFEEFHDDGSKTLLGGEVISAGLSAAEDLDAALDNIFNHQNVAPFVSKQLIQRLVTSNPTPAYVERVASVFNDNGQGVRGDLAAVIRSILLDDEALTAADRLGGAKLKEPLLRLTQLWRAFDAVGVNGLFRYSHPEWDFGQRPYGSPSVFNFFSPAYAQPGPIAAMGLVSP